MNMCSTGTANYFEINFVALAFGEPIKSLLVLSLRIMVQQFLDCFTMFLVELRNTPSQLTSLSSRRVHYSISNGRRISCSLTSTHLTFPHDVIGFFGKFMYAPFIRGPHRAILMKRQREVVSGRFQIVQALTKFIHLSLGAHNS